MATALPLRALPHAIARRQPAPGLIGHTDRGSQCASAEYRAALAQQQMRQSMSRKGECWDSAVAESFFATSNTNSSRTPYGIRIMTPMWP